MKILGEKSLSSKVKFGLELLFIALTLIDLGLIVVIGLTSVSQLSRYEITQEQIMSSILIIITLIVLLCTGIIALYVVSQFIKIFGNLKETKLFCKENSDALAKISVLCLIMGVLYLIILISLMCFIDGAIIGQSRRLLCSLLILTFALVFLVFGIGIRILNEIYKKAIEMKEENELTI